MAKFHHYALNNATSNLHVQYGILCLLLCIWMTYVLEKSELAIEQRQGTTGCGVVQLVDLLAEYFMP